MSSSLKFEYGLRWAELGRRIMSDDPNERAAALEMLERKDRQLEDYLNSLQTAGGLPPGWSFKNDVESDIDWINGSVVINQTIIADNTTVGRDFLIIGEADIYTSSGTSVVGDNVHLYCKINGPSSEQGSQGSSWRYEGTANGVASAPIEFHLNNTLAVRVNVTGEIKIRLYVGVPLSNSAIYRHRWSRISVVEVAFDDTYGDYNVLS